MAGLARRRVTGTSTTGEGRLAYHCCCSCFSFRLKVYRNIIRFILIHMASAFCRDCFPVCALSDGGHRVLQIDGFMCPAIPHKPSFGRGFSNGSSASDEMHALELLRSHPSQCGRQVLAISHEPLLAAAAPGIAAGAHCGFSAGGQVPAVLPTGGPVAPRGHQGHPPAAPAKRVAGAAVRHRGATPASR